MDISRKQFLGSLLAGATIGCTPAFATSKLVKSEPTEFEKCRNDILYFVDNYLVVDDKLHGKLKMTPQQREYLKRISTSQDYFFCAKGRQVGISTANNVFAYWKSIFFGPDHHVFIVEPHLRMKEDAKNLYWDVSNSGAFMPLPNRVHFITPYTMMAHDFTDRNSTFILDEFDFWDEHSLDSLSKKHLNRFLMNPVWAKEVSPEVFERFKSHMIVVSSLPMFDGTLASLINNVDDSRRLVLPSPTRGLKA
jgi:hypothetical protein